MLEIKCPYCGKRSQNEFSYGGDASVKRPELGKEISSIINSGSLVSDEIVKKLEPKKVIRFHDIDEEIKFEIPRKVKKLLDE